ncbi:MAG: ribosome-associated translation inhibitor RaiA [Caldiserica bacterium]|nr:MAG: ribosome-associated translation inhibitor RaiA [Caldisericota bacterium]
MDVEIVARNFELTQAIRDYCFKRLERVSKYFDEGTHGHITLSVEKGTHQAECFFNIPHKKGVHLKAKGEDIYSAIDILIDHLDEKLRRIREKMRDSKRKRVLKKEEMRAFLKTYSPDMNAIQKKYIKIEPMSFREAIERMENEGYKFWIYIDSKTELLQIAYKRENGGYGLIEPVIEEES